MKSASILVIEDDSIVARTIERSLRGEEFEISVATSGVDGLKMARQRPPDLVILDVIMPGMDGYTVCKEMRDDPILNAVPILFLTAKIKDEDRLNGFRAGGDDYLCKPFIVDELLLRVRAILRRTRRSFLAVSGDETDAGLSPRVQVIINEIAHGTRVLENNTWLVVGEYILDTRSFELHTPYRGTLRLTPVQYDLLYHLMSHPGQVFSPRRLLDEVWDYPNDVGSPDLVRVHVKNLRERVEPDPRAPSFIRTVPGYGYTASPE
jgi:DNA-binding response OmpR family regulator